VVKNEATARDKPILLFFTGSDWCVWCQKLERELFGTSDFAGSIERYAVPLKVDFPQHRKLTPRERRRNDLLKAKFEVEAFPSVLYYDVSNDKILWRHAYFATTPDEYFSDLAAKLGEKPAPPATYSKPSG